MENEAPKIFKPVVLIILFLAFFCIWTAVFAAPKKGFKTTFFNVGQGDSAYLEMPDGKNALIDGGPDRKVLEKLGGSMPFYKRKIDVVFLSHPHADHLAGLTYVLENYQVGRVVMPKSAYSSPEFQQFSRLIKDKNIPVTLAKSGTEIDFQDGVKTDVLYSQTTENIANLNNVSSIILFKYDKSNFLFTGDLEKDSSENMLSTNPEVKANVVKVPHHGSKDAFNENLYKKTQPQYAVISVGENKYGHPYRPLLDFLDKSGIKYLRTDQKGDIKFTSDGQTVRLEQ